MIAGHTQTQGVWSGAFTARLVVCAFVFAISATLILSYLDKKSADRNRHTEAVFRRIEARAQEIRSLEWLVTTTEDISPEAEAQVQAAKDDLVATVAALRPEAHNLESIDQIRPSIANYLQVADRQLHLVRTGNPEAAQELDFQQVTPQFEVLQRQVHEASDVEGRLAEA